jgi:Na+-transporting NADH:ubiquinone oxidoreductase subunit C
VKLRVVKGSAGPPAEDPYRVDGLSGATITSRGVTHTLEFWLGPNGFGPYLETLAAGRGQETK